MRGELGDPQLLPGASDAVSDCELLTLLFPR